MDIIPCCVGVGVTISPPSPPLLDVGEADAVVGVELVVSRLEFQPSGAVDMQ